MENAKYIDNTGYEIHAEQLLPCPFCGEVPELEFIGNYAPSQSRKVIIKCSNNDCRCTMTNATKRNTFEWVTNVSIKAWNKRV